MTAPSANPDLPGRAKVPLNLNRGSTAHLASAQAALVTWADRVCASSEHPSLSTAETVASLLEPPVDHSYSLWMANLGLIELFLCDTAIAHADRVDPNYTNIGTLVHCGLNGNTSAWSDSFADSAFVPGHRLPCQLVQGHKAKITHEDAHLAFVLIGDAVAHVSIGHTTNHRIWKTRMNMLVAPLLFGIELVTASVAYPYDDNECNNNSGLITSVRFAIDIITHLVRLGVALSNNSREIVEALCHTKKANLSVGDCLDFMRIIQSHARAKIFKDFVPSCVTAPATMPSSSRGPKPTATTRSSNSHFSITPLTGESPVAELEQLAFDFMCLPRPSCVALNDPDTLGDAWFQNEVKEHWDTICQDNPIPQIYKAFAEAWKKMMSPDDSTQPYLPPLARAIGFHEGCMPFCAHSQECTGNCIIVVTVIPEAASNNSATMAARASLLRWAAEQAVNVHELYAVIPDSIPASVARVVMASIAFLATNCSANVICFKHTTGPSARWSLATLTQASMSHMVNDPALLLAAEPSVRSSDAMLIWLKESHLTSSITKDTPPWESITCVEDARNLVPRIIKSWANEDPIRATYDCPYGTEESATLFAPIPLAVVTCRAQLAAAAALHASHAAVIQKIAQIMPQDNLPWMEEATRLSFQIGQDQDRVMAACLDLLHPLSSSDNAVVSIPALVALESASAAAKHPERPSALCTDFASASPGEIRKALLRPVTSETEIFGTNEFPSERFTGLADDGKINIALGMTVEILQQRRGAVEPPSTKDHHHSKLKGVIVNNRVAESRVVIHCQDPEDDQSEQNQWSTSAPVLSMRFSFENGPTKAGHPSLATNAKLRWSEAAYVHDVLPGKTVQQQCIARVISASRMTHDIANSAASRMLCDVTTFRERAKIEASNKRLIVLEPHLHPIDPCVIMAMKITLGWCDANYGSSSILIVGNGSGAHTAASLGSLISSQGSPQRVNEEKLRGLQQQHQVTQVAFMDLLSAGSSLKQEITITGQLVAMDPGAPVPDPKPIDPSISHTEGINSFSEWVRKSIAAVSTSAVARASKIDAFLAQQGLSLNDILLPKNMATLQEYVIQGSIGMLCEEEDEQLQIVVPYTLPPIFDIAPSPPAGGKVFRVTTYCESIVSNTSFTNRHVILSSPRLPPAALARLLWSKPSSLLFIASQCDNIMSFNPKYKIPDMKSVLLNPDEKSSAALLTGSGGGSCHKVLNATWDRGMILSDLFVTETSGIAQFINAETTLANAEAIMFLIMQAIAEEGGMVGRHVHSYQTLQALDAKKLIAIDSSIAEAAKSFRRLLHPRSIGTLISSTEGSRAILRTIIQEEFKGLPRILPLIMELCETCRPYSFTFAMVTAIPLAFGVTDPRGDLATLDDSDDEGPNPQAAAGTGKGKAKGRSPLRVAISTSSLMTERPTRYLHAEKSSIPGAKTKFRTVTVRVGKRMTQHSITLSLTMDDGALLDWGPNTGSDLHSGDLIELLVPKKTAVVDQPDPDARSFRFVVTNKRRSKVRWADIRTVAGRDQVKRDSHSLDEITVLATTSEAEAFLKFICDKPEEDILSKRCHNRLFSCRTERVCRTMLSTEASQAAAIAAATDETTLIVHGPAMEDAMSSAPHCICKEATAWSRAEECVRQASHAIIEYFNDEEKFQQSIKDMGIQAALLLPAGTCTAKHFTNEADLEALGENVILVQDPHLNKKWDTREVTTDTVEPKKEDKSSNWVSPTTKKATVQIGDVESRTQKKIYKTAGQGLPPICLTHQKEISQFRTHCAILNFGGIRLLNALKVHLQGDSTVMIGALANLLAQLSSGVQISSMLGPPGTGKSFSSNALILFLCAVTDIKVLWVASQNTTLDETGELLYKSMDVDSKAVHAKTEEEIPYVIRFAGLKGGANTNVPIKRDKASTWCRIVVATYARVLSWARMAGAGSTGLDFDLVVADEGQMNRSVAAIAALARILHVPAWALGDPYQPAGGAPTQATRDIWKWLDRYSFPVLRGKMIHLPRHEALKSMESHLAVTGFAVDWIRAVRRVGLSWNHSAAPPSTRLALRSEDGFPHRAPKIANLLPQEGSDKDGFSSTAAHEVFNHLKRMRIAESPSASGSIPPSPIEIKELRECTPSQEEQVVTNTKALEVIIPLILGDTIIECPVARLLCLAADSVSDILELATALPSSMLHLIPALLMAMPYEVEQSVELPDPLTYRQMRLREIAVLVTLCSSPKHLPKVTMAQSSGILPRPIHDLMLHVCQRFRGGNAHHVGCAFYPNSVGIMSGEEGIFPPSSRPLSLSNKPKQEFPSFWWIIGADSKDEEITREHQDELKLVLANIIAKRGDMVHDNDKIVIVGQYSKYTEWYDALTKTRTESKDVRTPINVAIGAKSHREIVERLDPKAAGPLLRLYSRVTTGVKAVGLTELICVAPFSKLTLFSTRPDNLVVAISRGILGNYTLMPPVDRNSLRGPLLDPVVSRWQAGMLMAGNATILLRKLPDDMSLKRNLQELLKEAIAAVERPSGKSRSSAAVHPEWVIELRAKVNVSIVHHLPSIGQGSEAEIIHSAYGWSSVRAQDLCPIPPLTLLIRESAEVAPGVGRSKKGTASSTILVAVPDGGARLTLKWIHHSTAEIATRASALIRDTQLTTPQNIVLKFRDKETLITPSEIKNNSLVVGNPVLEPTAIKVPWGGIAVFLMGPLTTRSALTREEVSLLRKLDPRKSYSSSEEKFAGFLWKDADIAGMSSKALNRASSPHDRPPSPDVTFPAPVRRWQAGRQLSGEESSGAVRVVSRVGSPVLPVPPAGSERPPSTALSPELADAEFGSSGGSPALPVPPAPPAQSSDSAAAPLSSPGLGSLSSEGSPALPVPPTTDPTSAQMDRPQTLPPGGVPSPSQSQLESVEEGERSTTHVADAESSPRTSKQPSPTRSVSKSDRVPSDTLDETSVQADSRRPVSSATQCKKVSLTDSEEDDITGSSTAVSKQQAQPTMSRFEQMSSASSKQTSQQEVAPGGQLSSDDQPPRLLTGQASRQASSEQLKVNTGSDLMDAPWRASSISATSRPGIREPGSTSRGTSPPAAVSKAPWRTSPAASPPGRSRSPHRPTGSDSRQATTRSRSASCPQPIVTGAEPWNVGKRLTSKSPSPVIGKETGIAPPSRDAAGSQSLSDEEERGGSKRRKTTPEVADTKAGASKRQVSIASSDSSSKRQKGLSSGTRSGGEIAESEIAATTTSKAAPKFPKVSLPNPFIGGQHTKITPVPLEKRIRSPPRRNVLEAALPEMRLSSKDPSLPRAKAAIAMGFSVVGGKKKATLVATSRKEVGSALESVTLISAEKLIDAAVDTFKDLLGKLDSLFFAIMFQSDPNQTEYEAIEAAATQATITLAQQVDAMTHEKGKALDSAADGKKKDLDLLVNRVAAIKFMIDATTTTALDWETALKTYPGNSSYKVLKKTYDMIMDAVEDANSHADAAICLVEAKSKEEAMEASDDEFQPDWDGNSDLEEIDDNVAKDLEDRMSLSGVFYNPYFNPAAVNHALDVINSLPNGAATWTLQLRTASLYQSVRTEHNLIAAILNREIDHTDIISDFADNVATVLCHSMAHMPTTTANWMLDFVQKVDKRYVCRSPKTKAKDVIVFDFFRTLTDAVGSITQDALQVVREALRIAGPANVWIISYAVNPNTRWNVRQHIWDKLVPLGFLSENIGLTYAKTGKGGKLDIASQWTNKRLVLFDDSYHIYREFAGYGPFQTEQSHLPFLIQRPRHRSHRHPRQHDSLIDAWYAYRAENADSEAQRAHDLFAQLISPDFWKEQVIQATAQALEEIASHRNRLNSAVQELIKEGMDSKTAEEQCKKNEQLKMQAFRAPDLWCQVLTSNSEIRTVTVMMPPQLAIAILVAVHHQAPLATMVPDPTPTIAFEGPVAMVGFGQHSVNKLYGSAMDNLVNTANEAHRAVGTHKEITLVDAGRYIHKNTKPALTAAIARAKQDADDNHLVDATREPRFLEFATTVHLRLKSLEGKVQTALDLMARTNSGGIVPESLLTSKSRGQSSGKKQPSSGTESLLFVRGNMKQIIRIALASPDDLLAAGDMTTFPALMEPMSLEHALAACERAGVPYEKEANVASRKMRAEQIRNAITEATAKRQVGGKTISLTEFISTPPENKVDFWAPRRFQLAPNFCNDPSVMAYSLWLINNLKCQSSRWGFDQGMFFRAEDQKPGTTTEDPPSEEDPWQEVAGSAASSSSTPPPRPNQ